MTAATFSRMVDSILAHLGEDALLRGSVSTRAHVEYNVQMVDRHGNVFVAQHVITLAKNNSPAPGDSVLIGGVTYTLETMTDDNNFAVRFVALKG